MRRRSLALLVFLPVGLYFTLMVALAAFVTHPPALGWIGLVVAALLATLAATLGMAFFSRMRANVERRHHHPGAVYRLLVVTDADVEADEIGTAVALRTIGRRAEIRVVAPVIASTLHLVAVDEERERSEAASRLDTTLATLAAAGIDARGAVGTDDPLQAVGDALADFPADEILLVSPIRPRRRWLDRDFERRARDAFDVPVSTVFGAG